MKRSLIIAAGITALLVSGAWAFMGMDKEPVAFYSGHTHDGDETHGAPAHSGGTDANGCHNASVPYHCH
jgi:hypothetical protein